jgi:hypothetical protein
MGAQASCGSQPGNGAVPKTIDFQDRVTCDVVLAKAGGGCFGIRRFPVSLMCFDVTSISFTLLLP